MSRAVPVCHRFATAWITGRATIHDSVTNAYVDDDALARVHVVPAAMCIGSRCAMWVDEQSRPSGGARYYRSMPPYDGTGDVSTGRGVCADNLRAEPWQDPAKEPV